MNPESIAYVTPEYEDGRKKRVEGEFADAHEFVPDCDCRDCATTQRDRLSVALFQMQEASKDLAQREKTLLAAYHVGQRASYTAGRSAEREQMIADGWRQTRYLAPVTDCEACLTPDACAIRGQCAHYLRERDGA